MNSEKTGIAVTGATGFVGRALVSLMQDDPRGVKALTRRPRAGERGLEWVTGTLDDMDALNTLAAGTDTFIHIAGLTKAVTRRKLMDVNETGAAMAARAARTAGVRRFILVSSIAAREPHLSAYALSKRAGEEAVLKEAGEMEVLVVRPPAIIGPGDPATAPMLSVLKRGWLPAPSGPALRNGRMSFVYMEDVARFLIDAIDRPISKKPLALHGGTQQTSWADLAQTASAVLSKPVRLLPIPPIILFSGAFVTQTLSALFWRSGFFNTGKVRELLHNDWIGDTGITNARDLHEALRLAFGMDVQA